MDRADDADIFIAGLGDVDVQRPRVPVFGEVVVDRLQNTEEQQADADARREHHRDPPGVGIVGFRVLAADPDLSDRQHNQSEAEQGDRIDRKHQIPVEGACQPRPKPAEEGGRAFLIGQREDHKSQDQNAGDDEDRIVNIQSERPDIVLTEFVFGREIPDPWIGIEHLLCRDFRHDSSHYALFYVV